MQNKTQNILTLIKEDHKPLKAAVQILTSEKAGPREKKKALKRFLVELKLHAKAEEMSLYENVLQSQDLRPEALEGYEEHGLADMLGSQLERSGFESKWTDEIAAKAKVLAELVRHHIEEEEKEMLSDLKASRQKNELIQMGSTYREKYKMLKKKVATDRRSANQSHKVSKPSRPAEAPMASQMHH